MEILGACSTILGLLEQAVKVVNTIRSYRELPAMIQGLQVDVNFTHQQINFIFVSLQNRFADQEYIRKMHTAVSQYLESLTYLAKDINNFLHKLSEQSRVHIAVSYFLADLEADITNFRTRLVGLTTLINTAFTCYEQEISLQMQIQMAQDLRIITQRFPVKSTVIEPSQFVADTPFLVNEISFDDLVIQPTPFHSTETVQIYEATFQGEAVVVKILHGTSIAPDVLDNFKKEIRAATKLTNKHVVQVYAVCKDKYNPDRIGIVMEKMDGNLRELLQLQKSFDWKWKIDVALQVAQGLRSVHANGMMHGNLMARNVFYNEHCFKIGDFAAAKKVIGIISKRDNRARSEDCRVYMAPELIAVTPYWSTSADIFSFGVLLWELATEKIPYFEQPRETGAIPNSLAALVTACCAVDRPARPDIHNVILELEALKQSPKFMATPATPAR